MKEFKLSGYITMLVSLIISIVSGYCTVVGMGKVFASAAYVTMFIASVIEMGRVVLIYDLHHYWDKMKFHQKVPGVLMLLIAIILSAMGIFGFMSNAHTQRTQEVVPIELEIKQKQSEIKVLNESIEINNQQLEQFDGKAFDKYTEMGYVTKAVNLQKEQQKITDKIYDDNRELQQKITKLNQEILQLQLNAEQKAPTLAHLKYYAKLFNVSNDMAIIIFIVMIMTVFDTLAMYLMITSDWILKLGEKKKEDELKPILEKQTYDTIYESLNGINEKINQMKKDDQKFDEFKEKIDSLLNQEKIDSELLGDYLDTTIQKINDYNVSMTTDIMTKMLSISTQIETIRDKMLSVNDIEEIYERIEKMINVLSFQVSNLKDTSLVDKLEKIENDIKKIYEDNSNKKEEIEKKYKKNIDRRVNKLIELIENDDSILQTNEFQKYMRENSFLLNKLKDYFQDNEIIKQYLDNL